MPHCADISKRKELTLMMHINCYTIRKTNTFGIIHMPLFKASCSVDPLCDSISVIHQLMACPKIPKKNVFFHITKQFVCFTHIEFFSLSSSPISAMTLKEKELFNIWNISMMRAISYRSRVTSASVHVE